MMTNNEIVREALASVLRKIEDAGRAISEIELPDNKEERKVRSDAKEDLVSAHRLVRNLWKVYEGKTLKQAAFEFHD